VLGKKKNEKVVNQHGPKDRRTAVKRGKPPSSGATSDQNNAKKRKHVRTKVNTEKGCSFHRSQGRKGRALKSWERERRTAKTSDPLSITENSRRSPIKMPIRREKGKTGGRGGRGNKQTGTVEET